MPNPRKIFESDMKRILQTVILEHTLPDEVNMAALKECCDKQYLSGITTKTMISGRIVADKTNIQITKAGLDYLYGKKDVKFIISTTIAVISVMINIAILISA